MAHLFQQSIATLADNSLHSTCITMLTVNGWNLCLNFAPYSSVPFVVSRTMSSFNPLSFTLAYHILHTYGLSIIVKVCAHAACSPPGRVHVPLLDLLLCAGRNGLHLLLCTLDTVTAYTPVTLFFSLMLDK